MKTTISKKSTRAPLILGCIINLIFSLGLFYFVTQQLYTDFTLQKLSSFNLFSYTPYMGINEKLAFTLMLSFYIYIISSFVLSLAAAIKKEPMFLNIQCIINFLLGAYKVYIDYAQLKTFSADSQFTLQFVLYSDLMFIITSAFFETTLRKHHRPKLFFVLDVLTFLPIFIPTICSWYQTEISKSMTPIFAENKDTINLITTLSWLAVPSFIVLYCAQFSADAGQKKDAEERKFDEVLEAKPQSEEGGEFKFTPVGAPTSTTTSTTSNTREMPVINSVDEPKLTTGFGARSKIIGVTTDETIETTIIEPKEDKKAKKKKKKEAKENKDTEPVESEETK